VSDLPERDPLADLVSRSLGTRVGSVSAEELPGDDGVERRRLRYETGAGPTAVLFERSPKGRTLEAQLLPFLARKTAHVPRVHARGLPPPHAALGPWLLMEDVLAAPFACDGDPADVLRAKLAVERATSADLPALRALGLRESADDLGSLASSPLGLVHGALLCANARRVARGVVLTGWARAFLGPAVIDAATLIADLERRGDQAGAARVRSVFVQESGDPGAEALLSAAGVKPA